MECLVLHAGTTVGATTLEPPASDARPEEGAAWTGLLRPTPAYEAIRATCQAFTRLLVAAPERPSAAPVDVTTGLPAGMEQMLEAIFAVQSLGLQLTTVDGEPIATEQVLIQDASELRDVVPTGGAPDVRADDLVMVLATLSDGRRDRW